MIYFCEFFICKIQKPNILLLFKVVDIVEKNFDWREAERELAIKTALIFIDSCIGMGDTDKAAVWIARFGFCSIHSSLWRQRRLFFVRFLVALGPLCVFLKTELFSNSLGFWTRQRDPKELMRHWKGCITSALMLFRWRIFPILCTALRPF